MYIWEVHKQGSMWYIKAKDGSDALEFLETECAYGYDVRVMRHDEDIYIPEKRWWNKVETLLQNNPPGIILHRTYEYDGRTSSRYRQDSSL